MSAMGAQRIVTKPRHVGRTYSERLFVPVRDRRVPTSAASFQRGLEALDLAGQLAAVTRTDIGLENQ